MIGLDTNVLVRYLAQDDEAQSLLATRFIEETLDTAQPGFISLVVLVEVVWVLESRYGCTKQEMINLLHRIVRIQQLFIQDIAIVLQAIRGFQSSQADFSDCLIEAIALAQGCSYTVTFDKAAARLPGMHKLSP